MEAKFRQTWSLGCDPGDELEGGLEEPPLPLPRPRPLPPPKDMVVFEGGGGGCGGKLCVTK